MYIHRRRQRRGDTSAHYPHKRYIYWSTKKGIVLWEAGNMYTLYVHENYYVAIIAQYLFFLRGVEFEACEVCIYVSM